MAHDIKFTTKSSRPVEVEVYFDEQQGVEPGWCYRARWVDTGEYCSADPLDAETEAEALEEAAHLFGLATCESGTILGEEDARYCLFEGCTRPARLRIPAEENLCDDGSPGVPVYACDECWGKTMQSLERLVE